MQHRKNETLPYYIFRTSQKNGTFRATPRLMFGDIARLAGRLATPNHFPASLRKRVVMRPSRPKYHLLYSEDSTDRPLQYPSCIHCLVIRPINAFWVDQYCRCAV